MGLTYDQKSEIRMAFDEAFVAPERRHSVRIAHQVDAEVTEWKKGRLGMPFSVRIEDFSTSGVGMVHGAPLDTGSQFLLKVPRPKWGDLIIVMEVVRCRAREDGQYIIGLELCSVMDQAAMEQFVKSIDRRGRVTARRTMLLFVLFGIVGICASLLMP